MRHYLKTIIITVVAAYIAYKFVPTIELGTDPRNLLIVFGGLWVIFQLINPIFSLVLLPINILTFGLVSFILNIAFIFALLNFLPGFLIGAYFFPGADVYGIVFPPIDFNQVATVILVAAIITISQKILHLIFE